MYCDFYQLTERPFNVTPDPRFLYLNARYREAIASLNYGITQRKGFITLIGEAGTGKTTLLKKLLEDLDQKTKSIFIFNTHVTFEEILEYIFAEFDLPVHNGKKLYMLQRLNTFLLEELRSGGNVALLIDEAQDLEFSVLEDLRLLSNLETAKEKILQIVLSGQPELGQKLSNPVLRQLRQRIGINCRLLPLSRDEIPEYIRFRLEAAGCPDLKLFTREGEDQVYHFSRGIPRLVNVVCDNALVIGYALGKKRIGADVVTEAAADLLSIEPQADGTPASLPAEATQSAVSAPGRNSWRARFGVISIVLVAVMVGLLSVGRTMLQRQGDEASSVPAEAQRLEVIRPGSQPRGTGVEHPAETTGEADPQGSQALAADPKELTAGAPVVRPVDTRPKTANGGTGTAPASPPFAGDERIAREDPPAASARLAGAPLHGAADVREPSGSAGHGEPSAHGAPEEAVRLRERGDAPQMPGVDVAVAAKVEPPRTSRPVEAPSEAETVTGRRDAEQQVPSAAANLQHLDGVQFASQVVRPGDSVSVIARRKYGQASYTILDLLKLANPELEDIDVISVGQTIRLPEFTEGFPILNDGAGHYGLLVFSSPQSPRAGALQAALRARGFDARVSAGHVGVRKPLYRVVVSGFSDRDEVVIAGRQMQKLFREDARLARLGG